MAREYDDLFRESRRISSSRRRRRRRKQKIRIALVSSVVCVILIFCSVWLVSFFSNGITSKGKEVSQYTLETNSKESLNKVTSIPQMTDKPSKTTEPIVISNNRTIIIDAGHGGKDPGSFTDEVNESDINLAIAKKVEAILKQRGYKVLMTRSDDSKVSLQTRVDYANDTDADVFISIHQNSLPKDTVTNGLETWYNEKSNKNNEALATFIQEELIQSTGAKDRGLRPDKTLMLPREIKKPNCLIEVGFLSSINECKNLTSSEYQTKVATGIANGLDEYFNQSSEIVQ